VNIRSLANKLDDLLDVRRDLAIDVLFLGETWHDADSVSFSRLRADGFQVVDRPRPRVRDDLSTNYGGFAVVAVPGVRLTRLDVGIQCESCELFCVRVTSASSSCIAAVVYRTGPVTSAFFTELSGVLDRLSTFILVVGDVDIRLDRPDDSASRQFTDTLAHGLACRVTVASHDRLTSSPPATCCCCLSKSSTLVFRTTGCCGGPRPLPSRLRSTRRGQVGRGVILTLTSSALH